MSAGSRNACKLPMSKLLFVLLVVAVLAVAGASWTLLSEPIRAVRVEGPLTRGEQRAIRGVVTHALDRPLLSLDLDRVKKQIRSLSWPREVSIRRIWPAALLITVEKEAAVAIWGSEGFLTSDARVVQLPEGRGRGTTKEPRPLDRGVETTDPFPSR